MGNSDRGEKKMENGSSRKKSEDGSSPERFSYSKNGDVSDSRLSFVHYIAMFHMNNNAT